MSMSGLGGGGVCRGAGESATGIGVNAAPALACRARLGVIVPSVNTVVEPWFCAAAPRGVAIHTARMLMADALSVDSVIAMDRDEGMRAIRQIASCRPQAVAYGCTASSVIQGVAYDAHLRQEIAGVAGVPATTATESILAAFRTLGIQRIAAVSPYTDDVDAAEHRFFAEAGYPILNSAHLGIADSFALASPSAEDIVALAMRGWSEEADGLLISCLNLRSHLVIDRIEQRIRKPVVTSTQAVLWRLLRLSGIEDRIEGYGRLLSKH